jgi:dihydroxyacetone kinase-like protein
VSHGGSPTTLGGSGREGLPEPRRSSDDSTISAPLVVAWLGNYRSGIDATAAELNRLDAALGDGDFGASMQRGLDAVMEVVPGVDESVAALLRTTGSTIVSSIGGTSGPLVGTFFLRAGMALNGAATCRPVELAAALSVGVEAVMELGGARVGDKTMVDALVPAVDVLVNATASGEHFADATAACARVAASAAASTSELVARKGRASLTGTGGIGHVDPGAKGVALLFEALATAAADAMPLGSAATTYRKGSI